MHIRQMPFLIKKFQNKSLSICTRLRSLYCEQIQLTINIRRSSNVPARWLAYAHYIIFEEIVYKDFMKNVYKSALRFYNFTYF